MKNQILNFQKHSPLTDNQTIILKNFIQEFLPSTGQKRRYSTNELRYIHATLDRIFKVQFGFNINPEDVLNAFIEMGYHNMTLKGEWKEDLKEIIPSKSGESVSGGIYSEYQAGFIYVDVQASTVKDLRRCTIETPNTGLLKSATSVILKKNIGDFKAIHAAK